jgi:hypothetical protein
MKLIRQIVVMRSRKLRRPEISRSAIMPPTLERPPDAVEKSGTSAAATRIATRLKLGRD